MKGLQSSKIEREQRLKLSKMKKLKREQRAGIPKPKRKQFKTIARILIFFLFSTSIGGFISPRFVYGEALPDLPLEFDPDITFADNVISFMAASGAATTNIDVLNDLYTNFSGSGYGVADLAGMYDIIDASTGVSLGMTDNEIFSHLGDESYFAENGYDLKLKNYQDWKSQLDNSQQLSKYGAQFIHEATLSSTGNPWEWDWGEIFREYLKRGAIPFSFNIQNLDTGYLIAMTLDDVLHTILTYWGVNINSGVPINVSFDSSFGYPQFLYNASVVGVQYGLARYFDSDIRPLAYVDGQYYMFTYGNFSNSTKYFRQKRYYTDGRITNENRGSVLGWSYNSKLQIPASELTSVDMVFNTLAELEQYIQDVRDGIETLPDREKESPDLINPNFSNLDGEDLERVAPSIEQGQALRPIPESDYDAFIQNANYNTENGQAHNNGPALDTLLDPYIDAPIVPIPTTAPAPRPVQPTQPDYPDAPELTDEQIEESLNVVTPDLTDIFPFCIPWDIKAIFTKFSASREAPYFEFPIQSQLFGIDEVIVIDFSMFDQQAEILRYLELILFVIALAVATRKLIGA